MPYDCYHDDEADNQAVVKVVVDHADAANVALGFSAA